MRVLLIGQSLIVLAIASGCTTAHVRDDTIRGVAVHECRPHSFFRSPGFLRGVQPGIFLSGPDVRKEAPPAADGLTRVLNVSTLENLFDPDAAPVIDKCRSRLRTIGEDEIEITIEWRDRNCDDSFDEEDFIDCRSRTSFRFSRMDLGLEERLGTGENSSAAIQGFLLVDAYCTQQIRAKRRHPATGMPLPDRGIMHLVVRVMSAQQVGSMGSQGSRDGS